MRNVGKKTEKPWTNEIRQVEVYLTVNKIDKDNRGSCVDPFVEDKEWNPYWTLCNCSWKPNYCTCFLLHASSSLVLLCYSTWPRPGLLLTVGDVVWRYVVTGSFLGAATTGHVRAVTVALLPCMALSPWLQSTLIVCHSLASYTRTAPQNFSVFKLDWLTALSLF